MVIAFHALLRRKCVASIVLILLFGVAALCERRTYAADVIPTDRMVPWIPNVTVGLLEPIPAHTTVRNMYELGCDKTGITNCASIIQTWINEADLQRIVNGLTNFVIYFPAGHYRIGTTIQIIYSDIKLLGDGPGQTYINMVGNGPIFNVGLHSEPSKSYTLVSGATRGSTSVVIDFGGCSAGSSGCLSVGDIVSIGETALFSDPVHVVNTSFGLYGGLGAMNYVKSISGTTINLALPLPKDFTNGAYFAQFSYNHGNSYGTGNPVCARDIVEGISFTHTNPPTAESGTSGDAFAVKFARNFLMTNCEVRYFPQHAALLEYTCVGGKISHSRFGDVIGVGSGTGGLRFNGTGYLVEDNIFANCGSGGAAAIEHDGGFGCAFFANFITNSGECVTMHASHPWMTLFEANVTENTFKTDSYYGSSSHYSIFRNVLTGGGFIPIKFNRWTRYCNIVGNILGQTDTSCCGGGPWKYEISATNQIYPAIFSFGLPNIGNSYFGGVTSDDRAWNYPGKYYFDYVLTGNTTSYTPLTFTNTQGPTNVFWGYNFAATGIRPYINYVRLLFQDSVNTNYYWTKFSAGGVYPLAMTPSNMTINTSFTISNGWTMYVGGAVGYQQIQETDKKTHLITGNYDYANRAVTWDANGVQGLPASLLYTNGAPSWWGTNRWPAIDPLHGAMVTPIPAQQRFMGIPAKTRVAPPSGVKVRPTPEILPGGPSSVLAGSIPLER